MPITLDIFHDNTPITDAFVFFDGKNTPETIKDGLTGLITCNYPINYVRVNIKDKDGNLLNHPIDKWNHLLDAMRYAVWTRYGQRAGQGQYSIRIR